MPRAFDVTTSTPRLELGSGREGEVTFTVSNAMHLPVRVRASVEPSGGARAEWMRLHEGESRELAPDGTTVFTVRVAVPPGAPAGEYAFKLLVVDVANPDEHYARGPSVAVTVPAAAPAPAKKPFPWGAAALVGGVVLIGGVVAFLLLRDGEDDAVGGSGVLPGLAQPCAEEAPRCAEGLVCSEGLCLGAEGFQGCGGDAQCASNRCVDGTCAPPFSEPGEACGDEADCRPPALCMSGRCLLPDGMECGEDAACMTGRCAEGTCRPRLAPADEQAFEQGERCEDDNDCLPPGMCVGKRICLLPVGAPCNHGDQCIFDSCRNGACAPHATLGGLCSAGRECGGRARCHDGRCLLPTSGERDTFACTRDAQCISGRCGDHLCLPPVEPGGGCEEDTDCRAPGVCLEGSCRLPDGLACTGEPECISGRCLSRVCQPVPGACSPPCAPGSTCVDGECRALPLVPVECVPSCPGGSACVRGRCEAIFE